MRTGEADSITLLPQLPNIANVARRGTTQPCLRDHPQNCGAHDQAEHSPHGANSTVPANFPSAHFWLHLTRPCGEGVQQAQAPRAHGAATKTADPESEVEWSGRTSS